MVQEKKIHIYSFVLFLHPLFARYVYDMSFTLHQERAKKASLKKPILKHITFIY